MKHLVYAICREPDLSAEALPAGLDGRPVVSIVADELVAVCSKAPATVASDVSSLRAYARVIETLHQHCTILPLRWGCVLDSHAEVVELLRRRRDEFRSGLHRLEGCMEMGLSIRLGLAESSSTADATLLPSEQAAPGTAYLKRCRIRFATEDGLRRAEAAALTRLRNAFEGLFVQSAAEPARAGPSRLLSVAFLVRRAQDASFRQAFEHLRKRSPEKMHLTGPWPPYTFVSSNTEEPHL